MKSSSLSVLFFMVMSTMPSMVFGASVAARAASAPQSVRASVERGNERNLVEHDDILNMDDADQQRAIGLSANFVGRFIGSLVMITTGAQDDSNKIKQDLNKLLDEIKQIIHRNIESNNSFIANRFESKEEAHAYYERLYKEIKEWCIDNFESYVQRINHISHDNKLERLREYFRVFFEATRRDFVQISHIVEKEFEVTVKPYFTSMMKSEEDSVASNNALTTRVNASINNAQNFIQLMQSVAEKLPLTEKEKRLMYINKTIMAELTPVFMNFGAKMMKDAIQSLIFQNVDFESQSWATNLVPRDNVSEQDRKDFENSHKADLQKCIEGVVSSIRRVLKDLTLSEDRFLQNSIVVTVRELNGFIERMSQVRTIEDVVTYR